MIRGRGRGGGCWDKLGHEGMCYQAPALPCLFPSAMCVEQKSVPEIRAAGEALAGVLKNTRLPLISADASSVLLRNALMVDNSPHYITAIFALKEGRAAPADV